MDHPAGALHCALSPLPEVAPRTRPMSLRVSMAGLRLGHEVLHQAPPDGRDGLQHCAGPYARPMQSLALVCRSSRLALPGHPPCTVELAPDMLRGLRVLSSEPVARCDVMKEQRRVLLRKKGRRAGLFMDTAHRSLAWRLRTASPRRRYGLVGIGSSTVVLYVIIP